MECSAGQKNLPALLFFARIKIQGYCSLVVPDVGDIAEI